MYFDFFALQGRFFGINPNSNILFFFSSRIFFSKLSGSPKRAHIACGSQWVPEGYCCDLSLCCTLQKTMFLLEEHIITTANLAQSAFSSKTFLGRQNLMHFDKHKSRRVHNCGAKQCISPVSQYPPDPPTKV